jgi:hypothetical protein
VDTRFDNLSSASGRNALEMDGFLLFDVRGQVISLRSGIATDIANNEKFSPQSNKLFYFTLTKISIFCSISNNFMIATKIMRHIYGLQIYFNIS